MTTLRKFGASLKDVRAVLGMIPPLLAVFNNAIFSIIPLTPVLRHRATFLVIVTSLVGLVATHNYARNPVHKKQKSRQLIRLAVACGATGLLLLAVYGIFLTYVQLHPPSNAIVDTLVDWIQIVLFTAPFVCWTICLAALGHEAFQWASPPGRHISKSVRSRRVGLHPHHR